MLLRQKDITWNSLQVDGVGAISRSSVVWLKKRQRTLIPVEKAALLGFSHPSRWLNTEKRLLEEVTGDAMNAYSVQLVLISKLVAGAF